jgi:hypothetical protein
MYPQYNFVPQQPMNQQVVPQSQQVVQQPVNENGILWVQGEAGAKSWAVAPGKSVMLMDSESNTFYIKSSDASGMPMPLRIFDYTERNNQQQSQPQVVQNQEIDTSQFVTRDELNEKLNELLDAKRERRREKVDG